MKERVAAVCTLLLAVAAGPVSAQEAQPGKGEAAVETEPAPAAPSDPNVARAKALLAEHEELRQKARELQARAESASGEDRLVLEEQAWERALSGHRKLIELAGVVRTQDVESEPGTTLHGELAKILGEAYPDYRRYLDWREKRTDKLRARHQSAGGEERDRLGEQLTDEQGKQQLTLDAVRELIREMEAIDLDVTRARADLVERVEARAEDLSGRLKLALKDRKRIAERIASNPDSKELLDESQRLDRRREGMTRLLVDNVAVMDGLGLETARYRELVIRSTGEISADLLDKEVALGLLSRWQEQASRWLGQRGPNWLFRAFLFFLILALFRVLAFLVKRVIRRAVSSSKLEMSQLLRATLIAWSSRMVMLLGLLVAVSQLGIEIGPLLAGLGIAGFIVGFALQDSLANFAAGAMILIYRPFDVGDVIEAATVMGTVNEMSLVSTTILTFDNQTLIIPNNKIWGDVIRNVTNQTERRVDLSFVISYENDADEVEAILSDILAGDERILAEPAPVIRLHELEDSGMRFIVRPWVATGDYWNTYWDLTREVKRRFDAAGISIAQPRRDLRVISQPRREDADRL